jgi:excisionase family DNA binding protein
MKISHLSTGKAAKALSVTPDTILKWIKSGKLDASRTAGGHYRIHPGEIEKLKFAAPPPLANRAESAANRVMPYCWEYNNARESSKACKECIVYQTHTQRCYELIKFAAEIGHKKLFCAGGCWNCQYFHNVCEEATGLLFVTNDEALGASLKKEAESRKFKIEIADCGYACSALVEQFRPDYILVDCGMGKEAVRHMIRHLMEDSRIPRIRVILAGDKEEIPDGCNSHTFTHIEKPFGIEDVTECLFAAAAH